MDNKEYIIKASLKRFVIFLLALLIPASCFAAVSDSSFHFFAPVISIANTILEITSVICIKQFFFLGDRNRTKFQIFNLVFCILFYFIALSFLISQKYYYVGFEQLNAISCIGKFFFGMGPYSGLQWLMVIGMVINIIYIKRYHDA